MEWEYIVRVTMPDGKEEKYFHKRPGREKLVKREGFPLGGGRYVAVTEIVKVLYPEGDVASFGRD
jgi:hypothetical protein